MPSINVHGAGDSQTGGGGSALNGVGQRVQDIINQLYNAGGSSGAFATAQAQLGGISPGLANIYAQTGALARGRAAGGGGPGAAAGRAGPSSVNVNVRVADMGLGKMDGTLQKILDAIKSGNQQATGVKSITAPVGSYRTPRSAAALGEVAYEQWAMRGINRQRAAIEKSDYASMRTKANEDNKLFDAQQKSRARLGFGAGGRGGLVPYGFGGLGVGGGGGGGGPSITMGGGPGGPTGGGDASFLGGGRPTLNLRPHIGLGAGIGVMAPIVGRILAKTATMAYGDLAASAPANRYGANMAGFALSGGWNQASWRNATNPTGSGLGAGNAVNDWAAMGISARQAVGMMQNFGLLGNSQGDQTGIVSAMGRAQWMPGLAGLSQGQQFAGASLLGQYGIGAPGAGGSMTSAIMKNSTQLANIAAVAGVNGINRGALVNSFMSGAGTSAGVAMGTPTVGSLASVITPYYNSGMGAAQADAASQAAISGNAGVWSSAMGDPFGAYRLSVLVKQNQTAGQLAATLGQNGFQQLQKQAPQLLAAYLSEAQNMSPQAGALLASIMQNYGGNAINPGFSGRIAGETMAAMGVPDIPANRLLYGGNITGLNPAQYAVGQNAGISGSSNPNYTQAQSLKYGSQYLAQLKKANPGASWGGIAGMYNGGGTPGYAKKWQAGYRAGNSTNTLVYDALGPGASPSDIANFQKNLLPGILAQSKATGVPASVIARTAGVESSGGRDPNAGTNVLQVTSSAVQAVGGQVIAPQAGPDAVTAAQIQNGIGTDNVDLALSQILTPLSTAANRFLTGATNFTASVEKLVIAVNQMSKIQPMGRH